jgi:hypothetical protein
MVFLSVVLALAASNFVSSVTSLCTENAGHCLIRRAY